MPEFHTTGYPVIGPSPCYAGHCISSSAQPGKVTQYAKISGYISFQDFISELKTTCDYIKELITTSPKWFQNLRVRQSPISFIVAHISHYSCSDFPSSFFKSRGSLTNVFNTQDTARWFSSFLDRDG